MTIEERRIALGWTRADLASRAGVTAQTVWSVERQPERAKRPETIAAVERALQAGEAATSPPGTPSDPRPILERISAIEEQIQWLVPRVENMSRLERVLAALDDAESQVLAELTAEPPAVRPPTGAMSPDEQAAAQPHPTRPTA